MVQVNRITMRLVRAQLSRPFENRWQRFETWAKVIIEVDADHLSGLGECTAMETPYYNYETTETAWHVLERYLVPLVLAADDADPLTVADAWRHVAGHEEAKAALECALWDVRAKAEGLPLCVALGGQLRQVPVAATVGIEPSVDELVSAVESADRDGYQRVRVKIRPGWDLAPVREVRRALPNVPLIADANAAYRRDDLEHLRKLDGLGLLAIEQPFAAPAIDDAADLQRWIETPVCLDESVKSLEDVVRAHRMSACHMVNIKVGRVGGVAEAVRVHDFCRDNGIANFVGAKYELGIGRWTNLALATLPNMTLPSDVGPSSRYYVDDGVDHHVAFSERGWAEPRSAPGLGIGLTGAATTTREVTVHKRKLVAQDASG